MLADGQTKHLLTEHCIMKTHRICLLNLSRVGRVVELTNFLSSFLGDFDVNGAASRLPDAGESTARDACDDELIDDVINEA